MCRLIFILLLINYSSFASPGDTIKIFFDIADPYLDKAALKTIDSAVYYDILNPVEKIGIIGYADYLGTEEANITLSENRAKQTAQYLEGLGFDSNKIEIVTGKGEIKRETENGSAGYYEDRRVDIIKGGVKPFSAGILSKVKKAGIDISKLKKNETIRLENMLFLPGRHVLRQESTIELLKLHKIMADNPTLKIAIEGHICCMLNSTDGYDYDTEEYKLSENRAKTIYEYLIYKGISKDRMTYKGFGMTKPLISPEVTEDDQNKNRRVEIRIISK